ncbi:GNAT family N-acetyltransferase [Candidatus Protochlamydia phocaeensis]|uniref:GNAT family N-acetyltransferase n=1 Tax=Candidatus Protochlamydia phocaeensis TaxID=1414722 RepID=UPI000A405776|nr:GNAT family N-acetyltransferase [Candidatus Protochlamydia phocaeensis]
MINIRQAIQTDFPQIWDIFHQVVKSGDTYVFDPATSYQEAEQAWMIAPLMTYVAEKDNKIVGTYILKPNQGGLGSHVANGSFMVHPQEHGKGIGKQMAFHALSEAKRIGFSAMQFNIVVSTNEAAVKLWKAVGFQIVGTLPGAFNHQKFGLVDAYVMHRFL